MLPRIATGTLPDNHPLIRQGQCRAVTIRAGHDLCIHTDGEFFCHVEDRVREVVIELLPGALTVLGRPPDSKLQRLG
jgi:diacylglycerol kinase family enzyme